MNNRIKEIRELEGLSRTAFGEKIGVSGDTINNLERGRAAIKDYHIKLICDKFGVSEDWIRTGKGDIKVKATRNQEIAEFANTLMEDVDSSFKKRFIGALSKLNESDWETLQKIVDEMIKED